MKFLIILCLAVACAAEDGPFVGYHERIGIPLAARILEAETAAIQSGSRIVGGQPAPLGSLPYLVGVLAYVDHRWSLCGSTMLSNTRAITAAHCWWDNWLQTDVLTMVFGSEYVFFGGIRVNTTDVHVHPGWDGVWAFENDIAIVNFNFVAYTHLIQPIALPTGSLLSSNFVGVWAQVSGWGWTRPGELSPTQVHSRVTVQVISNDVCNASFPSFITDRVICTSGVGGVGVCLGDEGGPLSIIENNQQVLIGVVIFSGPCGDGDPTAYARVSEHLPWILQKL